MGSTISHVHPHGNGLADGYADSHTDGNQHADGHRDGDGDVGTYAYCHLPRADRCL
jgi:hypothetical protein